MFFDYTWKLHQADSRDQRLLGILLMSSLSSPFNEHTASTCRQSMPQVRAQARLEHKVSRPA